MFFSGEWVNKHGTVGPYTAPGLKAAHKNLSGDLLLVFTLRISTFRGSQVVLHHSLKADLLWSSCGHRQGCWFLKTKMTSSQCLWAPGSLPQEKNWCCWGPSGSPLLTGTSLSVHNPPELPPWTPRTIMLFRNLLSYFLMVRFQLNTGSGLYKYIGKDREKH